MGAGNQTQVPGEQSVLLFTAGPSPALQMYFKLNLILIVSRKLSD